MHWNMDVRVGSNPLGSFTSSSDVRGVEMTNLEVTISPQGAGEAARVAAHCWAVMRSVMTGALMAPAGGGHVAN
jgi:hypothetical protein